jgi:small-conductance mechanosensitive channel
MLIIVGLIIIFQTTGIDLSALGLLVGALGVGIGFGLQSITNNFISGVIILFERPIKVGDRIELDNLAGNIVEISARATTVITNDNIAVIVPNSDFINSRVINWSHNNRNVRLNFPVGVSYNEDPERIRKLLLEVVAGNHGVLDTPEPYILFEGFGDSSLNFEVLVWTSEYTDRPKILRSELYYEIFKKFKEHDVEIPFPQRDIHLKTGFEKVVDKIDN